MKPLPRYTSRLFGKPLAMAPTELQELMQYVGDRTAAGGRLQRPTATKDGIQGSWSHAYLTEDGVLVIPISGTLVHRSSWLDAACGMRSYAALAEDLDLAMEGNCRGVMLRLDSPGGECAGLFTLADRLQSVAAVKPVWGVVDDMACSAAYLIAAHCERLFISETSVVGSIGVIAQHLDQSGWDKKNGLRYTAVFAGARKNDGTPHEALSDPALQSLQGEVDRIYGMFVDRVAARRGEDVESIRAQEAQVYTAQAAIDAGLADEFGSPEFAYEAFLNRLATGQPTSATGAAARYKQEQTMKLVKPAATQRGAAKPTATAKTDEEMKTSEETETSTETAAEETTETEPEPGMEKKDKAAASTPTTQNAAAQSAAEEISALCSIAGKPELAASLIIKRASVADVRKELMAAAATDHKVTSAITASTGTKDFNAFDPGRNPLLADAQRRAAAFKKEGR
jgi:capsid assembly protease